MDQLREALAKRGLDICEEMNTSWYNDVKPKPEMVSFPADKLGMLIANSKAIWPHFQRWHRALEQPIANPFDQFIAEQLQSALDEANIKPNDIYYVQDMTRLVAFQRLAQTTGICMFDNDIHLCVHEKYGPWFGLRALLVLEEQGPQCERPTAPVIVLDEEEIKASVKCMEAALAGEGWQMWAQMRQCISYGKKYAYSKSQLEYHHSKNQQILYDEDEE